jgi:hypothetical protein
MDTLTDILSLAFYARFLDRNEQECKLSGLEQSYLVFEKQKTQKKND